MAEGAGNQPVTLVLSHSDALVMFELLSRNVDDRDDEFNVRLEYQAEQCAIWRLKGALASQLVEPFMRNYDALVDAARLVSQDNYNPATGEELPDDRVLPALGYENRQ